MFCFWLVLPAAAAVVGLKWSHFFLKRFFLLFSNRRWSACVPLAVVRAPPAPHACNSSLDIGLLEAPKNEIEDDEMHTILRSARNTYPNLALLKKTVCLIF